MTRNTNSNFSEVPYIDKPRSIFDRSCGHKTSWNAGELIPVFWDTCLPGDTWRVTTSKVIRMQTLLTPIMDNIECDFYWFFVPWRLVWTHTREFFGENTTSAWVQQTQYRIPAISSPETTGFAPNTIADYLGLPVNITWSNQDRNAPMALPFRAYALICQEFFRDQNLSDPLNIPTGDSDQTGTNGSSYINDVANGGKPFKVAKYHDYFTSCLPQPLKNTSPISINVGQDINSFYPVYSLNVLTSNDITKFPKITGYGGQEITPESTGTVFKTGMQQGTGYGAINNSTASNIFASVGSNYATVDEPVTFPASSTNSKFQPNNLWTLVSQDLPNSFSVNELRLAFQMQRYYEQLARGGSRYIEYMRNFYGVTSPDARLQRPEYIGGNRFNINIHQIENTAQTQADFLGDVGAFSQTSDINSDFEKSFTEFGILMCVACTRYSHTYGQGIERAWTRRDLFEQYVPTLAHIGEQPVYSYEIYADGNMDNDDVFGYNEAWADYRYKSSRVSGEMRPGITNSLASWHLADYYTQTPTLSDSWIREDPAMIDRALAVTSQVSNQFFADLWFDCTVTRVMPMYSVPGLIDHF